MHKRKSYLTGLVIMLSGRLLIGASTGPRFTASDKMRFVINLERAGQVIILVYNMYGERVASLSADLLARQEIITWDCSGLATGVYIARVLHEGKEVACFKTAVVR